VQLRAICRTGMRWKQRAREDLQALNAFYCAMLPLPANCNGWSNVNTNRIPRQAILFRSDSKNISLLWGENRKQGGANTNDCWANIHEVVDESKSLRKNLQPQRPGDTLIKMSTLGYVNECKVVKHVTEKDVYSHDDIVMATRAFAKRINIDGYPR